MQLRENEIARRSLSGVEVRTTPTRVRWELPDLVTADGHGLRCHFSASIRALSDRTERQALQEVLLDGRDAVFADDISRHFLPEMRFAAARLAQIHSASDWIEKDATRQSLIDALKTAAVSCAFSCGLEVLPPFEAEVRSPSFERQRVAAMQQAQVEKLAAGQSERLAHATDLLKQFQALRSAAPEMSAGQVLEKINSADRGSLMQALLLGGASKQTGGALWAVAGPYLVRIHSDQPIDSKNPPKSELHPLPPTLGPLRSVRAAEVDGRRLLFVGAQRGFFAVELSDLASVRTYRDSGFESALGYNGVAWWSACRQFVATHSEAGIAAWNFDSPDAPTIAVRPAAMGILPDPSGEAFQPPSSTSISIRGGGGLMGPRNVLVLNQSLAVFSAGPRVLSWNGKMAKPLAEASRCEVVSLVTENRQLMAIYEDGTVCTLDEDGELVKTERRFGQVRSAAPLPWLDGSRLLAATEDGPIQCIGSDDPLVTQYLSVYRGLRVVAGSAALVAAVSPDRQRLILWNTWDARQPVAELFIGAQARHRIADVCFS